MTTVHLSDWGSRPDASLPGGICHCPEVLARYPGGSVIGSPVPFGGRTLVAYQRPDPIRDTDWRYPRLSDGAALRLLTSNDRVLSVEDYRDALRRAHDLRLAEIRVPLVVADADVEVPATLAYQQYLSGLAVLALLGQREVDLAIGERVVRLDRQALIETVRSYCDEMTGVPGRYTSEIVDHLALRGRIEAAADQVQLDAITID